MLCVSYRKEFFLSCYQDNLRCDDMLKSQSIFSAIFAIKKQKKKKKKKWAWSQSFFYSFLYFVQLQRQFINILVQKSSLFLYFFLFCFVLMLLQRWWLYRKTSIYVFFSYIFWHYLFDLNEPIFGMDVHARTNSNLKFNLRVKGERVRARKKNKM